MRFARRMSFLGALLMSLLLFGTIAVAQDSVGIIINNAVVSFDAPPVIENGRTLVPLRKVFEVINAGVVWNEKDQTVAVTKGDTKILVTVGSDSAYVGKALYKLDVKPKIISSRVYVPLRFVLEALNAKVAWNGTENEVLIFTQRSGAKFMARSVQEEGVTLFWHTDYGGARQTFVSDAPDLAGSEIGKNTATSVKVAPGWYAILYQYPGYKGKYQVFTENCSNLTREWIGNDSVCSVIVGKGLPDINPKGEVK